MFLSNFLSNLNVSRGSAFIWDSKIKNLKIITHFRFIDLDLLIGIERQKKTIYDNTKNIDLRSNNRPIKNTIPPSDTEEELFLPNEVIPSLSIEEPKLLDLPEVESKPEKQSTIFTDDYISRFNIINSGPLYVGTREQNMALMSALSIKPGWSKNDKWPDGTDVDDYSIVDWLKYGMGMSVGIGKDATIEARSHLYNKYVRSN